VSEINQTAKHLPFVNRLDEQEWFRDAISSIPRDGSSIRVFHGFGGVGKTQLCRHLMAKVERQQTGYSHLRHAFLRFDDNAPQSADLMLVRIRNDLANAGVEFDTFDYALMLHWALNMSEQDPPRLEKSFIAELGFGQAADEAAAGLAKQQFEEVAKDAFYSLSHEIPGLRLFFRTGRRYFFNKWRLRRLKKRRPELLRLFEADEKTPKSRQDIADIFREFFISDINHHIEENQNDRVILFIDEYEQLFNTVGNIRQFNENPIDSRLKYILKNAKGTMGCFFLREKLFWETDHAWTEALDKNQYLISGLKLPHAEEILDAFRIEDIEIREEILRNSEETVDGKTLYYPLILEMHIEHWKQLKESGETPKPENFNIEGREAKTRLQTMMYRVMRHYDVDLQEVVIHLSVSRQFDEDTIRETIDHLGKGPARKKVRLIKNLSFVRQTKDGWMSLHKAASDALVATADVDDIEEGREHLQAHFSKRVIEVRLADVNRQTTYAFNEATNLRKYQGIEGYIDYLEAHTKPLDAAGFNETLKAVWEDAANLAQSELGPENREALTAQNELAYELMQENRLDEAEKKFRDVLAVRERTLSPRDRFLAISQNNLASVLLERDQLEEAVEYLSKSHKIWSFQNQPSELEVAKVEMNIARTDLLSDKLEDAEKLQRRVMKNLETRFDNADDNDKDYIKLLTAQINNNLADTLIKLGRPGEALPHLSKAEDIWAKSVKHKHKNIAACLGLQGEAHTELEQYSQAIQKLDEAQNILEANYPELNPKVIEGLGNLAYTYATAGRFKEALPFARRCSELAEEAYPEGDDNRQAYNGALKAIADLAAEAE